jgi:hypothetical protein
MLLYDGKRRMIPLMAINILAGFFKVHLESYDKTFLV